MLNEMNNLTILTASRCLMGEEIRRHLGEDNGKIADLYHELEKGINPLSFFFPNLPLPGFKRRDAARAEVAALFKAIIADRRKNAKDDDEYEDIMGILMNVCSSFPKIESILPPSPSSIHFLTHNIERIQGRIQVRRRTARRYDDCPLVRRTAHILHHCHLDLTFTL